MCLSGDSLQAFSTETGSRLWESKGTVGFGSPGDLFVVNGKAWMVSLAKGIKRSKQASRLPAKTAVAIDIHTGAVTDSLPFTANQHHHRCFRNKATENCIIIGYSGIQIFDLEAGTTDGWIYLVTASHAEGCVNVVCAPELEMELSLMSRWSPKGHDGFKVLASVYAPDRRKAFDQVRDRANSLATEAKIGGETYQWLMITEENAIASLKAAA